MNERQWKSDQNRIILRSFIFPIENYESIQRMNGDRENTIVVFAATISASSQTIGTLKLQIWEFRVHKINPRVWKDATNL
jgi:hypothetical protein